MKNSRVILDERSGRWAAALARNLPADVRLVQARGHDQCARELTAAPASVVALELTLTNAPEVVAFTSQVVRRHPWSAVVILSSEELADDEHVVREAGAMHVFHSPRELAGCRQTLERHFARIPLEPVELAESVWNSLPWKSAVQA